MQKFWFLFFSLFTTFYLYDGTSTYFSEKVYITSLLIQYFSLYFIFSKSERPFSLNKIFYLFTFFFFGVAPLIQSIKHVALFGARYLTLDEYFYMNILILGILILYQIMYAQISKIRIAPLQKTAIISRQISQLSIKKGLFLCLLSTFSFIMTFYVKNFNIVEMLVRESSEGTGQSADISSSLSIVINFFIRPIGMICFFFFLLSKRKNVFILIYLFVVAFATCFPSSMPRFYAAAMYIPLFLITMPFLFKKNYFSLIFIGSLLVIFPFLNQFRLWDNNMSIEFNFNFDMFTQGHFDSYQNFALIVFENIVTYGYQLLGVVLFWVPRSTWPQKPIGSGEFLADKEQFYFGNVSANYFAEGYINFGFIGIFIFIVALAWFTARMDKTYWTTVNGNKHNPFQVIYFMMIGILFFIMRGDLLSSFAFTMGFIVAILIIMRITSSKV